MPSANSTPQSLQVMRLSLLAGVLMLGGFFLYAHGRPSWEPAVVAPAIQYAMIAFTILAVSVAVLLKGRVGRESDPGRRAGLLIAGWSVCEAAGLFGAVIFYYSGQWQLYALGLLAMVCSFALLPIAANSASAGSLDAREG